VRGAIYLGLFGACEIGVDVSAECVSSTAAGPLVEIDLGANGNPLRHGESDQAVTQRGIHLGSPTRQILRRYTIIDQSAKLCSGGPRPVGVTYVALAGKNTIAFTVGRGVVQQISLIAGTHRHPCDH